jgi:hypothetical protein
VKIGEESRGAPLARAEGAEESFGSLRVLRDLRVNGSSDQVGGRDRVMTDWRVMTDRRELSFVFNLSRGTDFKGPVTALNAWPGGP